MAFNERSIKLADQIAAAAKANGETVFHGKMEERINEGVGDLLGGAKVESVLSCFCSRENYVYQQLYPPAAHQQVF